MANYTWSSSLNLNTLQPGDILTLPSGAQSRKTATGFETVQSNQPQPTINPTTNQPTNMVNVSPEVYKQVQDTTTKTNALLGTNINATPTPPPVPVEKVEPTVGGSTPDVTKGVTDTTAQYFTGLQTQIDALTKQVQDANKKQLDLINQQKADAQTKIDEYKTKMEDTLGNVQDLTQPFQQQLESTERERLKVEENYFANQNSIAELNTLLTDSLNAVNEAKGVTGLSAIRTPTINKIKEDYDARAGILQAVMSARNNQISVATNLIDRSINAITNDRKSQLGYYENVLSYYDSLRTTEGNKLITLNKDEKDYVNAQINLIQNKLDESQKTANYIKDLMINPNTANALERAGVTLNDTVYEINQKLAKDAYIQEVKDINNKQQSEGLVSITPQQVASKPVDEVSEQTDSAGNKTYWWNPKVATNKIKLALDIAQENRLAAEKTGTLDILDVARYNDLYPNAGVIIGDTKAIANSKVINSQKPENIVRPPIEAAKAAGDKYETVIKDIDANAGGLFSTPELKTTAKNIAKEVYKIQETKPLPGTIKKQGEFVISGNVQTGVANKFINSISNYLFGNK